MSSGTIGILSDSAITSGAVPTPVRAHDFVARSIDAREDVRHFAAARGFFSPGSVVVEFQEAMRPVGLSQNLVIDTASFHASMATFKDEVVLVFQAVDHPEFRTISFSDHLMAQGPPRDTWTIPTWSLLFDESVIEQGVLSLSASVERIKRGLLPRRSSELLALAQEAVVRMTEREGEDLEEWAERLGREVSEADD